MGYVQLSAMLLEAGRELPTLGYAARFMTENSDYMSEHLIMAVIFLALGIWIVWGQIRRTAVHDVRDAGAVLSSMVVNGEAPVNVAPLRRRARGQISLDSRPARWYNIPQPNKGE